MTDTNVNTNVDRQSQWNTVHVGPTTGVTGADDATFPTRPRTIQGDSSSQSGDKVHPYTFDSHHPHLIPLDLSPSPAPPPKHVKMQSLNHSDNTNGNTSTTDGSAGSTADASTPDVSTLDDQYNQLLDQAIDEQIQARPDKVGDSVNQSLLDKLNGVNGDIVDQSTLDDLGGVDSNAEKEMTRLELAFFHPEIAATLTADEKIVLNKIKDEMTQKTAGNDALANFTPDSSEVDQKLNDQYDAQYITALNDYATKNNLSGEEMQILQTLHYHPDAQINVSSDITQANAAIEKAALGALSAKYGLPTTMPAGLPAAQTEQYDATVRSNYRYLNESYVEASGLSDDQKALLRQAINDPNAAGIPDNIKQLALSITSKSQKSIIDTYGFLPALDKAPAVWTGSKVSFNAVNYLNDLNKILQTQLQTVKDQGNRVILANFLKLIGEAIDQLQQQIYAMEAQDAEIGKKLNAAMQEIQQAQTKQNLQTMADQKAQQDQIAEKQKKATKVQNIMKIVGPIAMALTVVATIASLGTLGPLAIAVSLAFTALTVAEQTSGKQIISKAMNVIGEIAGKCGNLSPKQQREWNLASEVIMAVLITAIAHNPKYMVGTIMVAGQTIAASNVIGTSCEESGMDPNKAAMISGIAGAGIMLLTSLPAAMKGLSKTATETVEFLSEEARATTKMLQETETALLLAVSEGNIPQVLYQSLKFAIVLLRKLLVEYGLNMAKQALRIEEGLDVTMSNPMSTLASFMKAGNSGLTSWNYVIQAQMDKIQIKLDLLEGDLAKRTAIMTELMEQMQQQIAKLYKIMDGLVDWLPELSNLQIKKYEDAKVDFVTQNSM